MANNNKNNNNDDDNDCTTIGLSSFVSFMTLIRYYISQIQLFTNTVV